MTSGQVEFSSPVWTGRHDFCQGCLTAKIALGFLALDLNLAVDR